MKHFSVVLSILLLNGCIDAFDGSWYTPEALTEYAMWNNEVPEAYIEWITLESGLVEGEDEAPTLAGVWLHQCLADDDCATPEREGFDAARQDKTILYLHRIHPTLRTQMFCAIRV